MVRSDWQVGSGDWQVGSGDSHKVIVVVMI